MNSHLRSRRDYGEQDWVTKEQMASICPTCAEKMEANGLTRIRAHVLLKAMVENGLTASEAKRRLASVYTADKWKTMPKGWDDKSRKSFWDSLTGDVKHKVTKCIKQMEGKVDDAGAFCASLADRIEGKDWRSERSSSMVASRWYQYKEDWDVDNGWAVMATSQLIEYISRRNRNLRVAFDLRSSAYGDYEVYFDDEVINAGRLRDVTPEKIRMILKQAWSLYGSKTAGDRTAYYRHYTTRGGDPRWIRAKYPGVADDGTPFKRGEEVLYWPRMPRGKNIMVGKRAQEAWAQFQSEAADEEFMNPGGRYGSADSEVAKALMEIAKSLLS